MRYLVRLVTPPNGTLCDPFAGSGSTGKAAHLEGFDSVLIEQDAHYCEIARARIEHVGARVEYVEHDSAVPESHAKKTGNKPVPVPSPTDALDAGVWDDGEW